MAAFRVGVVTGNRRHKLRLIEFNASVVEHFVHRLDGFGRHHGGGTYFVNLQNRGRVAGTESGDPGREALLVVTFVDWLDFVLRVRLVKPLRQ